MSKYTVKENSFEVLLENIDLVFREKIIEYYLGTRQLRHFAVGGKLQTDAVAPKVGKFCETVLRFLQFEIAGEYTPFNEGIPNFIVACRKLEKTPKVKGNDSLRIIIPRALSFVYTIRNKRGSIHVGKDADTTDIDLIIMVEIVNWIFCELIRLYSDLDLENGINFIDSVSFVENSDIWEIGGTKRVLRSDLGCREKTLLLAYHERFSGPSSARDLLKWSEFENSLPLFRKSILIPLHKANLIQFEQTDDSITISPLGEKEVEENFLNCVA